MKIQTKLKYIAILIIMMGSVIGCTKEDIKSDTVDVKFNLSFLTKAIGDEPMPTRYIVEVFASNDTTKLLDHKEFASADVSLSLVDGKTYNFYFWADMGKGYYRAESLRAVAFSSAVASVNKVCYSGESLGYTASVNSAALSVQLTRPVARIDYINTGLPQNDSVAILYSQVPKLYNVLKKQAEDVVDLTIKSMYDADATADKPYAVDFIFVPQSESMNIEAGSKSLTNISVKVNNNTIIKGNFY